MYLMKKGTRHGRRARNWAGRSWGRLEGAVERLLEPWRAEERDHELSLFRYQALKAISELRPST
jgi:hypothetical protein